MTDLPAIRGGLVVALQTGCMHQRYTCVLLLAVLGCGLDTEPTVIAPHADSANDHPARWRNMPGQALFTMIGPVESSLADNACILFLDWSEEDTGSVIRHVFIEPIAEGAPCHRLRNAVGVTEEDGIQLLVPSAQRISAGAEIEALEKLTEGLADEHGEIEGDEFRYFELTSTPVRGAEGRVDQTFHGSVGSLGEVCVQYVEMTGLLFGEVRGVVEPAPCTRTTAVAAGDFVFLKDTSLHSDDALTQAFAEQRPAGYFWLSSNLFPLPRFE